MIISKEAFKMPDLDPFYIFTTVSFLIVVLIFFIRIEHRLTKLETLIAVIQKDFSKCQPNLDKNIP